jgi:hypothetical protein
MDLDVVAAAIFSAGQTCMSFAIEGLSFLQRCKNQILIGMTAPPCLTIKRSDEYQEKNRTFSHTDSLSICVPQPIFLL